MTIELGLTGTASIVVSPEATALAQGTGDVDVLSTHDLLKLMQQATMDAMRDNLPEKVITAGLRVNLDHLQMGVGGDNSWGLPVNEPYRIKSDQIHQWTFTLSPATK